MTTDRVAILDGSWDESWAGRRPDQRGWLHRLGAALGRLFGRRRAGLVVLDPEKPRGKGARRTREVSDRTKPIDPGDLIDVGNDRRARIAAPHSPPPAPRRTGSSPAVRVAATELGRDRYDPLDALITRLLSTSDDPAPAPPTPAEEAWLERLLPLIEYELMAQGSTAVGCQRTADQLGELVALTDTDFNGAVRLVSRDPAIAAAILAAANSVERQRGSQVGDLRTAVARLGLADTRRIAIAIATRALHDPDGPAVGSPHRQRAERDLHRAMTCAFADAAWAARAGAVGGEDPFVAGMFHDVGRPLVHRAVRALERRGRIEPVPADALTVVIERSHAAIGAEALASWGLPRRFGELARYHQVAAPPAALDGPDLQRLALVSYLVTARVGEPVAMAAARRATAALGLERVELRTLALEVHELAQRVTDLFGVRDAPTTWDATDAGR